MDRSVETVQQQIQFTKCFGHLWLTSPSLFWNTFSFIDFKLASLIFTLVTTHNHPSPLSAQSNYVLCVLILFPLLVWLGNTCVSYLSSFPAWNVFEGMFRNLLWCSRHFLNGSSFGTESGFSSKTFDYFACTQCLGIVCTHDIQKTIYLLDLVYALVWFFLVCFLSMSCNDIMPYYNSCCQVVFCFSLVPLWRSEL